VDKGNNEVRNGKRKYNQKDENKVHKTLQK
jgi:hypothetical protein